MVEAAEAVVDDSVLVGVVIMCEQVFERILADLGPTDVIPEQGRLIGVDQLLALRIDKIGICVGGRAVASAVRFAEDGLIIERPVVIAGVIQAHLHLRVTHSLGQLARDVAHGAAAGRGEVRVLAGEQAEAVMMLRDQHDVFRAGLLEQRGPLLRVPVFGLPHVREALVGEIFPVGLDVVLVRWALANAYGVGVPLGIGIVGVPVVLGRNFAELEGWVCVGGHGIRAPVDENADLRVVIPLRDRVRAQRLPVCKIKLRHNCSSCQP